ncbi:tRNA pseudouridine synthase C [compost metagenome]
MKKQAITHFQKLLTGEVAIPSNGFPTSRYALLRCQPQTGRFRQIRRHLKHLFHHLIGDTSHGDGRHNRSFRMQGVHRMLLHAERLSFPHPHEGGRVDVSAPLDREFRKAMDLFGWTLETRE